MDTKRAARIVVGVDGSDSSIEALRQAETLARALGAPLEAVAAWEFPPMLEVYLPGVDWSPERDAEEVLAESVDRAFGADRPEGLTTTTRQGPPAQVLIKESEDASMLVVGSRGRGGFTGLLLGSVGISCAQHAHCPVLIVRGETTATRG